MTKPVKIFLGVFGGLMAVGGGSIYLYFIAKDKNGKTAFDRYKEKKNASEEQPPVNTEVGSTSSNTNTTTTPTPTAPNTAPTTEVSPNMEKKASSYMGKKVFAKFSGIPIYGAAQQGLNGSAIPKKTPSQIAKSTSNEYLGTVLYGNDSNGDLLIEMITGIYSTDWKFTFKKIWFNKAYVK